MILLMIIAALVILGLCFGSFVNALVWRLHEQAKASKKKNEALSITKGRSMCPQCKHELAGRDLVPVLSWLSLGGKCRYCKKPISKQYPLVELATAGLFVASYIWWPVAFSSPQKAIFVLWLALLVGLMALLVYDLKWLLLPNRLVYPLTAVALAIAAVAVGSADEPLRAAVDVVLAVAVGGGIFYVLFQVSDGRWIGGGDVKLGWLLGLVAATPARSILIIFIAALLGSLVSVPLMARHKMERNSVIPFGPFLIVAAIIVQLFGSDILTWYQTTFFPYTV